MQPIFHPDELDPRIPILRMRCLERKGLISPCDGDPRLVAQSLQTTSGINSWVLRRG